MKKVFLSTFLIVALALSFVACKPKTDKPTEGKEIAMVTDYGDITDQSFNQTTWEAVKDYAARNNKTYAYYKPAGDSTPERVDKIEQAIQEGAKVVVMPGFAFAGAVYACQDKYPNVKFVALDVGEFDIHDQFYKHNSEGAWDGLKDENDKPHISQNVACVIFNEHESGYLAGYAAVKNGERALGFLGGMAVPAVQRFGGGYVQGIKDAATEENVDVDLWYIYGGQFFGDAAIKQKMDLWVQEGCKTIFACGGGIYTSVVDAIKGKDKTIYKLIGVDTDQSKIEPTKDITVLTSATKSLREATFTCLDKFYGVDDAKWSEIAGKVITYGLVNEGNREYVGLPRDTWSMTTFTQAEYDKIIGKIRSEQVTVSDALMGPNELTALLNGSKVTIKNADFGGSIK